MKNQTPASNPRDPKFNLQAPNSQFQAPTPRGALVAILDQFNISTASFDRLRSDSYEKHIAARSLDELEGFYRTLMEPYGSYEEKQKLCPVWNKGGKSGDKLPDARTLSRIKHRIMAEHVAVELAVGRVGWTRLIQPYLTLLRTIEPLAVKQKNKNPKTLPSAFRSFAVFGGIDFAAAGFPTIPLNQQRHILPKHWERFPLSWGRGPG